MTILEAILKVLEKENGPLSIQEITRRIIDNNLYSFNSPSPTSMVRLTLRRHCEGVEFSASRPNKYFYLMGARSTTVYGLLTNAPNVISSDEVLNDQDAELLPEEKMQKVYLEHRQELREQLLNCILNSEPSFFEHLVVKLLLALGYGYGNEAGKVVGKSHDGGVDGIINEDKLGLDKIYIQAKRYAPTNTVGRKEIQAFAGAMKTVSKGVFLTTSTFTKEAKKEAREQYGKQIALIDGTMLTDLMINCEIGIRNSHTFNIYELDIGFFA